MSVIWDSSKKEYYFFNAAHTVTRMGGKPRFDVRCQAEVDAQLLQIQVQLPSEMAHDGHPFKELIIGIATFAGSLFAERSKQHIVSVSADDQLVTKRVGRWGGEETVSERREMPDIFKGRVLSFSAEICTRSKDDKKEIASIYERIIVEPFLKGDIVKLVSVIPLGITYQGLKDCVEAFQKIRDPVHRASIIEALSERYLFGRSDRWTVCLPLSIEANANPSTKIDFTSWKPIVAAAKDYAELSGKLISKQIDINTEDVEGNTLLMAALICERSEFARDCLRSGMFTKINAQNFQHQNALCLACDSGDVRVVRDLLTFQDLDVNQCGRDRKSPIWIAVQEDQVEIVEALAVSGKIEDPNQMYRGRTLFMKACEHRNIPILECISKLPGIDVNFSNRDGDTALLISVKAGLNVAEVVFKMPQLDVNIDGDEPENVPLLQALVANDERILRLFLQHPRFELDLLMKHLEKLPRLALNKSIAVVEEYFPEKMREWFAAHPEERLARLVLAGKHDQARRELEEHWQANQPFNIVNFIRADEPVMRRFLRENLYETMCKLFFTDNAIERYSLEDQCTIFECLDPHFSQYISPARIYTDSGITLLQQRTLAPRGTQIIVDYLRKKETSSLPREGSISVCPDYRTFAEVLQKLAMDPELKDGYCHYFIVNECEENPNFLKSHVTPLFFKKSGGKWEVIITDSTTEFKNRTKHCGPLVDRILQTETAFPETFVVQRIHVNTFWRQSDDFSCIIFALRDLACFSRLGDRLLQELSGDHEKVHYFANLPPEFMKPTQSINDITSYSEARRRSGGNLTMATRKPPGHETLLENLARHKDEHSHNALAKQRLEKYLNIVMKTVIQTFKSA